MDTSTFTEKYHCQVQFQYLFDGQSKQHYPIISHLRQEGIFLDLSLFAAYPIVTFVESTLHGCTLYFDRIRDVNFQQCTISDLNIQTPSFNGTLGFAKSSVHLDRLRVSSSPNILSFVESEVIHDSSTALEGFSLHTLALLDVDLDDLNLTPIINQVHAGQIILTELQESVPIIFSVPKQLKSLRLKHTTLHRFPEFPDESELEILFLEEVQFIRLDPTHVFELNRLSSLEEITINRTGIKYLPYLNLQNLKEINLDVQIEVDPKMIAKLRIQDVGIVRL